MVYVANNSRLRSLVYELSYMGREESESNDSSDSIDFLVCVVVGTTVVGVGFNFPVTSTFLIGLGAEYAPVNGTKQNYTVTVSGFGSATSTYNKKDSYNIFVSPGFVIDKDSSPKN